MRTFLVISGIWVLACAGPATSTSGADGTLAPGQVGPVTGETSYEDLVDHFGADVLEDTEVHLGEGMTQAGTRVALGDDQGFSVLWASPERERPTRITDIESGWRTAEGIGHGSSLEDLEAVVGPFELYGFEWDYWGAADLSGTAFDTDAGSIVVRLEPGPDAEPEEVLKVTGDALFSSEDPDMRAVSPRVAKIEVTFSE